MVFLEAGSSRPRQPGEPRFGRGLLRASSWWRDCGGARVGWAVRALDPPGLQLVTRRSEQLRFTPTRKDATAIGDPLVGLAWADRGLLTYRAMPPGSAAESTGRRRAPGGATLPRDGRRDTSRRARPQPGGTNVPMP